MAIKSIVPFVLLFLVACSPAHARTRGYNRIESCGHKKADSATDALSDRSAKLILHPTTEYPYGLIGWKNEFKCANKYMATLTAHGLTNVKDDGKRYAHDHFSVYIADSDCNMLGRIDIPWGHDHTQIQIENADLVMKGKGTRIIMRDGNDKYCEVKIDTTTRAMTCDIVPSDQIIKANVPPSERGYPAELDYGN